MTTMRTIGDDEEEEFDNDGDDGDDKEGKEDEEKVAIYFHLVTLSLPKGD